MSSFISHLHDDLRGARLTRRGASLNFSDNEQTYKTYPRMEQVILPQPAPVSMPLEKALVKRISASGGAATALSLKDLGSLFGHALKQRTGSMHRNYPSGGARFPIETYLVSAEIQGAKPGVFHYRPETHTLERLWDLPANIELEELLLHGKPDDLQFSSLLVFTSFWERCAAKYGDFAYILSLLEAGHVSQNVLVVGAALDIAARPMGGFDDAKIAALLDLDEEHEQVVHAITLSKPATSGREPENDSEYYE